VTVDRRLKLGDATNASAQWAANLLGPVAVLLGLELTYAFVEPACRDGTTLPVHLSFAAASAFALLGGAIAWREWRRWGGVPSSGQGGAEARSRFMAITGLLVSAISMLVLVAQWLATLFFHPCQ
jgi:hypothetical protein